LNFNDLGCGEVDKRQEDFIIVAKEREKRGEKVENRRDYYVGILRCCLNYFGMSGISVGVCSAVKFQLNYSRKAGEEEAART
jgi:hypothetical protein